MLGFRIYLAFTFTAAAVSPIVLLALKPEWGLLAPLLTALVFAVSAGLVLGHIFTKSLREISQRLLSVERGHLEEGPLPRTPGEPKETAALKQNVVSMLQRLRYDADELKELVSKYTGDLASADAEMEVLAAALRYAGEAVEILDPMGRCVYVNPAFEALTGYTANDVFGRRVTDVLRSFEPLDRLLTILSKPGDEGIFRGGGPGFRRDGTCFEQAVTLAGICTKDDTLKYIVGVRRDLTELRRAQETLRVRDRLASVGTLAAGVAHEVNNPLTYVIANLSFAVSLMNELQEANPDVEVVGELKDALSEAQEGAERVKTIVRDLKTFARSDTESITLLDVNDVVESSLKMTANEIRHSAKLTLSLDAAVPVLGNAAKLSQVFINLLVNAIQALQGNRAAANEIRIATRSNSKKVWIEVTDTGCGMSADTLQHAFDPFFTTKQVGVGTGLGLSICHNIIAAMGGEIAIDSRENGGTTIAVSLPTADIDKLSEEKDELALPAQKLDQIHVLVIDDEAPVGKSFARILHDCRVDVALSADEAFSLMVAQDHHVIFCDLMMPDVSGIELYERVVRELPDRAQRIVFMTGGVFTPASEDFVRKHAANVMQKPFKAETIRALVAERSTARQHYSA